MDGCDSILWTRHPLRLACAMLLLSSLWACGGSGEPEEVPSTPDMSTVPEVDMGQQPSNVCRPSCAAGATCVNGACMAPPKTDMGMMPQGAAVGQACMAGSDCADGLCLSDEGIPGGYCSKICGTGLPGADDRCPSGSVCVQAGASASVCLDVCMTDTECRSGYVCEDVGMQGSVCLPACTDDLECEYDEICDMSGRCVVDAASKGRVGSSCDFDEDCAGEICLDEDSTDFPGGTCSADCTGRNDGDFCVGTDPTSGICLVFEEGDGLCLPSCTTTTECRDGYVCTVDEGDANPQGYGFCLPGCQVLACPSDRVCDISGLCLEQMSFPQQITTRTLGPFAVNDTMFESITIDVPDDALSFGVTFESDNPGEGSPAVIQLLGPTGETIYDAFNPLQSSMIYFDGSFSPTGFIYPNAPSLNLSPGTYILTFGAYAPANVTAHLHIKSGPTPGQERMPTTFWFLDNSYFDAEQARNDPDFQAAVNKMKNIYAAVGIDVAPIEYRDVDEDLAIEFAAFNSDEYSIEAVIGAAIGPAPAAGVHMLFNDQLFTGDGGALYGVSAGLPGPPALNDTAALGVFVALETHEVNGQLDAVELGATMSHELGHYLGLFHISEADGSSHDPLNDTVECVDSNGDGTISGVECGASATNMMFWTSDPDYTQDQISPAQSWVIHRNPAIFE